MTNAKEYYKSTRLVDTMNWTLDMTMNFAQEYAKVYHKEMSNKTIQKIKDYFNSLNKTNNKMFKNNYMLIMSCFSSAIKIIENESTKQ